MRAALRILPRRPFALAIRPMPNFYSKSMFPKAIYKPNFQTSAKNNAHLLLLATGVGVFSYLMYEDYNTKGLKGDPIKDEMGNTPDWVKNEDQVKYAGIKPSGKSAGSKVVMQDPNGECVYYYRKTPSKKSELLNELVTAELGLKILNPENAPRMFVIESEPDNKGKVRYDVASECLARDGHISENLGQWMRKYSEDDEAIRVRPNNLGAAIAFTDIIGDSDNKLANIVTIENPKEHCYPIDNGSSFQINTKPTLNKEELLAKITEYKPKTSDQKASEIASENFGGVDANDDPRLDKSDPKALEKAKNVFLRGIQEDLDNGNVARTYVRFAQLDKSEINAVVDKFSSLMTTDEKEAYKSKLFSRQEVVREFIKENKHTIDEHLKRQPTKTKTLSCPEGMSKS